MAIHYVLYKIRYVILSKGTIFFSSSASSKLHKYDILIDIQRLPVCVMLMCILVQVINEALRCGNIVKFVHRKALKDVRYKGKQRCIRNVFRLSLQIPFVLIT